MNFPDFGKNDTNQIFETYSFFNKKCLQMKQRSAFGKPPTIPPDIYPQKECKAIYFRLAKL